MANRNRTAGNAYELRIVNRYNSFGFSDAGGEIIPLFPVVGSTRNLSRKLDSMKVDIYTEDPTKFKDFGLVIQAKTTTNTTPYPKLLKQMEPAVKMLGGFPVVYHKQTQRVQDKGDTPRFMARGEYVAMHAKDFEVVYTELQTYKEVYQEIMNYFDSFPDDVQKDLNKFLKERNL